jgi:hypothetical protein
MFLHVVRAEHLEGYRVRAWFNDGSQGDIDLSKSLSGPIFEPLRNAEYFKAFSISGHTLTWPNGADFAPEYLQSLMAVAAGSAASG